jgi:hypothetical protein
VQPTLDARHGSAHRGDAPSFIGSKVIIALAWQFLERDDIATPRVAVHVTEHGSVHLSLIFRSRGDAENLREALRQSGHALMCEEATA